MTQNLHFMQSTLKPEAFTSNAEVEQCLNELRLQFGNQFEKLIISDTFDEHNHQYVNLVQKGGGVLGVALVGYTYILEKVGIRFLRLAGTSAGAINTSLLAVIGNKEDAKSEKILEYLCKLDFFSLVDGNRAAQWLIKMVIKKKKFEQQITEYLKFLLISFVALFVADLAFLGLEHWFGWAGTAAAVLFFVSCFLLLLLFVLFIWISSLLRKFKESGYGINPGKVFYEWIKARMEENGVHTVSDLNGKVESLPKLSVRKPDKQNASTLKGDVTFISSELISENKIEFPRMCPLFSEHIDDLHPAGFVRASMSIPFFFESFIIENIRPTPKIKAAWENIFDPGTDPPPQARFVDGGILSDFPINIFYNPAIIEPRLPSFGIDLDDSDPNQEKQSDATNWSLLSYVGRIFNTIRFYYDKDFLLKNKVFQKGIGKIPLAEFNWLNFFLTDEEKLKMFVKGARAACDFLKGFDWAAYQQERIQMQTILNEKQAPEKPGNG